MLNQARISFSQYCRDSFFRNFKIYNQQRIPASGPTVIYMNHANYQYDGYVAQYFKMRKPIMLGSIVMRQMQPFRAFNRRVDAIPIYRPIDIAKAVKGTIQSVQENKIVGLGTQFTKCKPGQTILLKDAKQLKITEIINDQEILVQNPKNLKYQKMGKFKVIPIHNHQTFFGQTWRRLSKGDACLIYPEGRSHDTAELMPIRAGLSNIVFGAIDKYKIQITLVPVTMHSYNLQNYRSQWTLQVGHPFKATMEMYQTFKKNPKQGINILGGMIDQRLKDVKIDLVGEPNISKAINLRKLRDVQKKQQKQRALLDKRNMEVQMAKIINKIRAEKKKDGQAYQRLHDLNQLLQNNNVDITELNKDNYKIADLVRLMYYSIKVLIKFALCLPGMVLYGPTALIVQNWVKQKHQIYIEERKWANVPGTPTDIHASFKTGYFVVLAPFQTLLNAILVYKGLEATTKMKSNQILKVVGIMTALLPIYHQIFKYAYDSMGKDHKQLRHSFIRIFNQKLVQEVKTMQEKVLQKIRPSL